MAATTIYLGSEIKLNMYVEDIEGLTMDDYEFTLEAWTNNKKIVTIQKDETIRIDGSNRLIRLDTNELGVGSLKIKMTAEIRDLDFYDEYRTEVSVAVPNIVIRNPYES